MRKVLYLIPFMGLWVILPTFAQTDYSELEKLVAADFAAYDNFGYAVAVSGDYAVVGSPFDAENASGGSSLLNAGSAYIFERNASTGDWEQVQKIVASDRSAQYAFGSSVAIDANWIVVGAPSSAGLQGKMYTFVRNMTTGVWTQSGGTKQASDGAPGDLFGQSVSISDADLIVGAPGNGTGKAYIYRRSQNGNWNQSFDFSSPNPVTGGEYGYSVSMDGSFAVVGAARETAVNSTNVTKQEGGRAYLYERTGNLSIWGYNQELARDLAISFSFYGRTVDISGDWAVVGAPYAPIGTKTQKGRVWIFRNNNGTWEETQDFFPSDWNTTTGQYFGSSVSIDGDIMAIGYERDNPGAGSVFFYGWTGTSWAFKGVEVPDDIGTTGLFGKSVSVDGSYAILGAPWHDPSNTTDAGAAWMYFTEGSCTPGEITELTVETELCEGESANFVLSGNLNDNTEWEWYSASCGGTSVGSGTMIEVSPTSSTEYFVRAEGGCETPGECQSFFVTVNPLPLVNVSGPKLACFGDEITLIGSGASVYSYEPKTISDGVPFIPGRPGTLSVTITGSDFNGCEDTLDLSIEIVSKPEVTITQKKRCAYHR